MQGFMTTARVHDDRKGRHYYTTASQAEVSYMVVMTLAVIMKQDS